MAIKLAEIFDDEYLRNNDSTHLDGSVTNIEIWQERFKRIIVYPLSQYDLPSGQVGGPFVRSYAFFN